MYDRRNDNRKLLFDKGGEPMWHAAWVERCGRTSTVYAEKYNLLKTYEFAKNH